MESDRKIPTLKVQGWCQENGNMPFFEVSALNGTNIDSAFDTVAQEALKSQEITTANDVLKQSVRIGHETNKKPACC